MAKPTGNVAARAEELVRGPIEALGLRLWDVRYEKEGADWYLRVLIDRDEPLDTDTCEKASRAIDPILDEADPVESSYILEVGSPGLGRKLVKPQHFAAMQGRKVRIGLYRANEAGQKQLSGVLQGRTEESLSLCLPEGEIELPTKELTGVWLCDDEDLFK